MTNMELYHYGVKGMRWGRRKARPKMSASARMARRRKIVKGVALGVGAAALGYGAYRYGKNPVNRAKLYTHYSNARLKGGDAVDMVRAHGVKGAARETYRKLNGPAAKARREVARMQRGDRLHDAAGQIANLGAQAKYLGVRGSARAVGKAVKTTGKVVGYGARVTTNEVGKAAKKRAGAAASAAGSYVLGGSHSKTRANLRSAASSARGAGQKLRQGRAAAEMAADIYRSRRKYQGKHAAHFAYDSPGEALYHFALDPYGRYAIL